MIKRLLTNTSSTLPQALYAKWPVLAVFTAFIVFSGCTTQDFEPPSGNDDVYRLTLANSSDMELTYTPVVRFYYLDGKEQFEMPSKEMSPGDPEILLAESKSGVIGVSVDVLIEPIQATMKLELEVGTGTGDDFQIDEVPESKNNDFAVFIRYGEWY